MKKIQSCISVTITAKGHSQTLVNALRGFLHQTQTPKEIILIGDTQSLHDAKKVLSNNELKQVILVTFNGLKNDARNTGFANANGTHILFSDHDMVPQHTLIEECEKLIKSYDALIIPEQGPNQGTYLQRVYALEKKLVMTDPASLTPRLFRKNLFANGQLPFNNSFGVLDEWGFYAMLKKTLPKIGQTRAFFTVYNYESLESRIQKNFLKGKSLKMLARTDGNEAHRRANPVVRGMNMFSKQWRLFFRHPIEFVGVIIVKLLDLIFFATGTL